MALHLRIEAVSRVLELDNLRFAGSPISRLPRCDIAVTAHVLDRVEGGSGVLERVIRLRCRRFRLLRHVISALKLDFSTRHRHFRFLLILSQLRQNVKVVDCDRFILVHRVVQLSLQVCFCKVAAYLLTRTRLQEFVLCVVLVH